MHSPSSETSSITSHDVFSMSSYANSSAMDTSVNYQKSREGGRAKWGSYLFDSFSKDNSRSSRNTNGPVWLEKSLNEARDSEEENMSISVQSVSSFLRGQNVPLDPRVIAEREAKRRIAKELQQAIKYQLQERENLKKMEKERQYQSERLEEEMLARQIEAEMKRVEAEQKIQFEKIENDRKKSEAMRKALEKATLEAQINRQKKRREKVAIQTAIDETISIQKTEKKTEIFIDNQSRSGFSTSKVQENSDRSTISHTPNPESNVDKEDDDHDGETVLIGTPIKLKKKNLETFRRKLHKRQQNQEYSKNTSNDDAATLKPANSVESNTECNQASRMIQTPKVLSELDEIALVLQSMPLVPFVPLSNEFFSYNQLNNLAVLMTAQNRINCPNLMIPLISKNLTAKNSNYKLDLNEFILPQNNQQTITPQIQKVDQKQVANGGFESQTKIPSVPPTPEQCVHTTQDSITSAEVKEQYHKVPIKLEISSNPPPTVSQLKQAQTETLSKEMYLSTTQLPHDGTFMKEDAFSSTSTENRFVDKEREVKILTPQKYRNASRLKENMKAIGTQTESFLFCEYCSYQHQHHHHHCSGHPEELDISTSTLQTEASKSKNKKNSENRPQWGVRNPPVRYLKASERDPFYGKVQNKRYLKKAASESVKTDDSCAHKSCLLVKNLLPKRFENFTRDNLCKNILPIKYDRFGRICLMDEQNFTDNEAFRRVNKCDVYTSDADSSIDSRHKSCFLQNANDFKTSLSNF